MKFILGTKIGMTQTFDEQGKAVPVTVIRVDPNTVVQVRTKDKDGYDAVQVGTGETKKLSRALKGHFKELGNFRFVREFRDGMDFKRGDTLDASVFTPGDTVKVSGIAKGKGFQGAVKRHGFHGMPSGHGHSAVTRHIGSIGQRFPQHTLKGKRMAGHMGNMRITLRGLKVLAVDTENHLLGLKGAVPGNKGALLEIVLIK